MQTKTLQLPFMEAHKVLNLKIYINSGRQISSDTVQRTAVRKEPQTSQLITCHFKTTGCTLNAAEKFWSILTHETKTSLIHFKKSTTGKFLNVRSTLIYFASYSNAARHESKSSLKVGERLPKVLHSGWQSPGGSLCPFPGIIWVVSLWIFLLLPPTLASCQILIQHFSVCWVRTGAGIR